MSLGIPLHPTFSLDNIAKLEPPGHTQQCHRAQFEPVTLPTKSLGSTQVGRTTDNITTVDNVARLNPLVIPLTTSLGLTRVGQTIDSIARLDPSVMPLTTSLGSTPRSCI